MTKAGIVKDLLKYKKCIITDSVFNEVVKSGKEKFYEGAFIIEGLIKNRLLEVEKTSENEAENLGKGEMSTLEIFKKKKCTAIITDDRKFLCELEKQGVSYPLRISKELINLADLRSKEECIDRATALRQLLFLGAELLKISVHDIYSLAERHGIEKGGTAEQHLKSKKTTDKLF